MVCSMVSVWVSWQIMWVTSLLLTPGEHKDSTVALPRDTETQLWIYLMSQNIRSYSEHRYIIKLFQTDKVHNYKFGDQCQQSKGIISIQTLLRDAYFFLTNPNYLRKKSTICIIFLYQTHTLEMSSLQMTCPVMGHWNFILTKIKHLNYEQIAHDY